MGENLLVDRRTAAPTMQSPSNVALVMQPRAAPSSQCSPNNPAMNVNAPRSHSYEEHVILSSMLQSFLS